MPLPLAVGESFLPLVIHLNHPSLPFRLPHWAIVSPNSLCFIYPCFGFCSWPGTLLFKLLLSDPGTTNLDVFYLFLHTLDEQLWT